MALIRVLRVLEYVGEEEIVWNTLRKGGVSANGELRTSTQGGILIKSGLVGYPDFPNSEETQS